MTQQAGTDRGLRAAVVGATGDIGTSVVRSLADDGRVESVVALSRRRPPGEDAAGERWPPVDVGRERCARQPRAAFQGVDAFQEVDAAAGRPAPRWAARGTRDRDRLAAPTHGRGDPHAA
jgi:uncharacterized protein YbjT (DUF2867 family)